MSIVTRIFTLIAFALLLVASGELFNGFNLRQKRLADVRSDTVQLARIAGLDMVRILEGAHQLLATLAKLPVERGWDERACSIVRATASSDFEYDHIVAVDRNGNVQCGITKMSRIGTMMPDRDLLDRIMTTAGFSVGSYGRSLASGNEVIRVGYPVVDDAGTVIGAVFAGINVTWLNTALSQWELGEQATIDITDRNGILIARHPEPRAVGQSITNSLKRFLSAADYGVIEVAEAGGVARLYGYIPVNVGLSDGLGVFVGRDKMRVFADINRSMWLNGAVVVAALLLSGAISMMYVRRFLTRPFHILLIAAGRWRNGDWAARAGATSGIPEFDRMAAAFDGMASAVNERDQALQHRDALRQIEEEKHKASELALAEAQEVAHLGNWSFEPRSNIATYSEESYRILGVEPKEFNPSYESYLSQIHPDDRVAFERAFADSVDNHGSFEGDYRIVIDNGSVKFIHHIARHFYDAENRHVRTVGTMQDITERKRIEEQIIRMEHYDRLTELANRGTFVQALGDVIALAHRSSKSFAVLYLDLDHFKDVNDTLGHAVGNLLLQAVARRLQAAVRKADTVARFGGDEFALIQTDILGPGDAAVLADKILRTIGEPVAIQGNEIRAAASIGIAVYGPDSPDPETLLSHADVALYRAKSEGRGTYKFFTDAMDAEMRDRVTLGTELREAVAAGELFLMYQPQVDVDTGRILGVEALVRWHHPTRGLVSPAEFIPVAEGSGLIVALGHWVLHEACRQMKEWLDAGIAPPLIGVNVSGLQFKNPLELEHDIAATLSETALPYEFLELELTESVFMEASQEHNDLLQRLRNAGLRIAIDDFGTGYSSLEYLGRFPVDRVKIGQTFMLDLTSRSRNAIVVKAAIGLAHDLGLDVMVEGVETLEQLELVRSWSGRKVQGYYFSRPLPAGEVEAVLRAGKISPARPVSPEIAA